MKNTLKKVLCTALAAVSLSALVTFPTPLNSTTSDNAVVNIMEADASVTTKAYYFVKVTKDGNIRKGPGKKYELAGTVNKGEIYPVFNESDKWVRISEYGTDNTDKRRCVAKMYLDTKSVTTVQVRIKDNNLRAYSFPSKNAGKTGKVLSTGNTSIYSIAIEHGSFPLFSSCTIWGSLDRSGTKWIPIQSRPVILGMIYNSPTDENAVFTDNNKLIDSWIKKGLLKG